MGVYAMLHKFNSDNFKLILFFSNGDLNENTSIKMT